MKTRLSVAGSLAVMIVLVAGAAQALPVQQPDATDMVNGPVRALAQASSGERSFIWIGGTFTSVLDAHGAAVASVHGLAAFDDATGAPDPSMHVPSVTKGEGTGTVEDLSLAPDGSVLYLAGKFDHVDGAARGNVAAINPATGTLLPFAPKSGAAFSVYATATNVYVGGKKLLSFLPSGSATPGFKAPIAVIDPNLRAHNTLPEFRGITSLGGTLVTACECDGITDANGSHQTKAVVEIDAATGNWNGWAPANQESDSDAWGIRVLVAPDPSTSRPTVYLAAGGSDFTAAFDFVTGVQVWKTDTSGSSQAITMYQGTLVIGGHFNWTASPGNPQCGSNQSPNTSCYHSPHLVAMDPLNGHVVLMPGTGAPWNPGICCKYNGVWALLADADGSSLHVGGEFTLAGGTWVSTTGLGKTAGGANQSYYARFSDAPPAP
jgi:hypothetical protein